jgi:TonB-dependent siderophore receptor
MDPLLGYMSLPLRLLRRCSKHQRSMERTVRITPAVAFACLASAGLFPVDRVDAAIRETTNISARALELALNLFAKERNIQLVYRSELVSDRQSYGAVGELTVEEGLTEILDGTGLSYRYIDSRRIAIVPMTADDRKTEDLAATYKDANGNIAEVVVTAYKFLSVDTSGTTNLPLPIEEVPQSISVVSGDFIRAANLKTLGEISEYTPGAINSGNPANNGSVIKLRGFSSGRAVDGLNIQAGSTSFEPDYAIFDRLEVVKGPTSVVYGISSPGGLVNFVTKSGTPETIDYLQAQVGSWNNYRLEGQFAGSLDSEGRVRAIGIGVRDQGDSFQDINKHEKTSVYGGIDLDLSDSAKAYLHGGYERFVRNGFDGIPTRTDGSPAPVPRSFFIGSPDIETTSSIYHAEGKLSWLATDLWELSLKANYENGRNKGSTVYGYGLKDNGDISLSAFRYDLPGMGTRYDNYAIGITSVYKLDAMGLKESFVSLAALYQDSRTGFSGVSPPAPFFVTRNIMQGESIITDALEQLVASAGGAPSESWHRANTVTYSGQAVLKPMEPLSLLLGVAHSLPELTIDGTGGRRPFNFESQTSYRVGITYEFAPRAYPYISFSQSFSPQEITSLNAKGVPSPLPSLEGEQYEVGLKYRSRDDQLLVRGAVFQIKQKNQGQYDRTVNGTDYFKPIGEVTHKGLELETVGHLTSQWQVNAGYAYLDAKVSEDSQAALVGQRRLYLPKQVWSLYTTYTLPDRLVRGLTFGGGIRHVSSQQTSYRSEAANNAAGLRETLDLPDYSLVDVTASYEVNKWLLQLNARNVFDKHYFINNYQTLFYGNAVGDPANVALTIRVEF